MSKQLRFVRRITVRQTLVIGDVGITEESKVAGVKDGRELASTQKLSEIEMEAVGRPPTVLSINVPPSVPIYLKKGSLLSIFGITEKNWHSITMKLHFANWFKRIIYGGYSFSYHRIVGTIPFSLLVSSKSRSLIWNQKGQKSFVTLALDGTKDWAILNRSSLQVFTGGTLNVTMHRTPKYVNKTIAASFQLPSKPLTGLHSWNHCGFTMLSGRGQAGLVGEGSIYHIALKEGENVFVNKHNLLALSVNGQTDLANCVVKYSFAGKDVSEESTVNILSSDTKNLSLDKKEDHYSPPGGFSYYWHLTKRYINAMVKYSSKVRGKFVNHFIGNQEFVKVVGPRSILLQSSVSELNSFLIPSTATGKVGATQSRKSSDYLNYVTIEKGKGAVFQSTPDFKETVSHIEKKN